MGAKPIPEGFHTVTPFLAVKGVDEVIEFLKSTFDAEVREHFPRPDGTILHAEVRIGDSVVMMGEPTNPEETQAGQLYVYVNDTDATYARALEAGAESLMEPMDMYYGDRNAGVKDAVGNVWWIATHVEDVAPEELRKRAEAAMQEQS